MDVKTCIDEGRLRIYPLHYGSVVSLMQLANRLEEDGETFVVVPQVRDIPDGATVVAINDNYGSRTLDVTVAHESFEPVPKGAQLPRESDVLVECASRPVRCVPTNIDAAITALQELKAKMVLASELGEDA